MYSEQDHIISAPSPNQQLTARCYSADHAGLGAAHEAHRGRQGDEGQAGLGAGDVCLVHWRSIAGESDANLSTVKCAGANQQQH